ncbi:hypothetical protein BVG16_06110 [Paenibacillus selenitireducens]|uniref:DUF917 domain-containing protein n=1 Tax=Paenibacillus selenitireducens TaxID=1324314 RepID=A0A1T2XKP4_9BACL|nr:DUF917 domain-containing protein [Paenibacillus selenitireducens]OPA80306.1 hypothetical protein BVG16_06110 [Paenibacillus selenitireducens]
MNNNKLTELNEQAIQYIAVGAAVLGTGGGGDPHIGKLMAIEAIRKYGPVRVVSPDELGDEDLIVPLSMIGAPTVMNEKIPSTLQMTKPLELLEKELGRKVTAIMPIEVGGGNSLVPVIAAAERGIPMLDADAMGRAFPESQMVTFYLDGLDCSPVTMADERGNSVLLHAIDGVWEERIARAITIQMGGSASICDYPVTGAQVKQSAIPHTLTLAYEIGKTLFESKELKQNPIEALLKQLHGYALFYGKAVDIRRRTEGGFTRGEAVFEGTGAQKGRSMRLFFQNEFLLATEDGRSLAVTPDLISLLDQDTGMPITTENLKYGARVTAVGFPCDPRWRTPKGLETVGPQYFGYDTPYVTIEELAAEKGGELS